MEANLSMLTNTQWKGFSLLELLVVIAIVSIFSGWGMRLYSQQMMKVQRYAAKIALLQLARQLEHFYQHHHTYEGASLAKLNLPTSIETGHYRIQLTRLGKTHFFIQAVPVRNQIRDVECGALGLDQAGRRHMTGQGLVTHCWQ